MGLQQASSSASSDRRALITGITGQDGSYLCELLLARGYRVWGMVRRSSGVNLERIRHLLGDPDDPEAPLQLRYGDLNDGASLRELLKQIWPDEIYNLAAQSHVQVAFEMPEYTCEITGMGAVRMLEAVRQLGLPARFFQAASSELFGRPETSVQSELTPFYPQNPYGIAKLCAFHMTRLYREAYGLFAVNGILFNHESPRRGETFVTRKITRAVGRIVAGAQQRLRLGNLQACRDWGFAGDYVQAMWRMLQTERPRDYVIATGESHSVREFCDLAFARAGMPLSWSGAGLSERACDASGTVRVEVDPKLFRPLEVGQLVGDARRAREELGWEPHVNFARLVQMMVDYDLELARREAGRSDLPTE